MKYRFGVFLVALAFCSASSVAQSAAPDGAGSARMAVPKSRIRSAPPEYTNERRPVFEFESDVTVTKFECSFNAGTYRGCSSPVTYDATSEGPYSFCVRGVYSDGTKEEPPACYSWNYDLTPPTATVSEPVTGNGVASAKPRISGAVNEPFCTVQVVIDDKPVGDALADAEGKWSLISSMSLSNGEHKVRAIATDRAGNQGSSSAVTTFLVKTDPPTTAIVERPPETSGSPHAVFEFASPSGATSFECQLDTAAEFSPCEEVWLVKRLTPGSHKLRVRAKDIAGNVDPAPQEHAWTVALGAGATPCTPTRDEAAAAGCASTGTQPTLALSLLGSVLLLTIRRRRV